MKEKIDKWCKKHIFIFGVVVFVILMPVIWGIIYPFTSSWEKVWREAFKYGLSTAVALLWMKGIWQKKVFSFQCPHFFKNLFSFGLLGVIGAAGAFIFSADTVDLNPSIMTVMGCIAMNLAIAVCEEIIFRGIILHSMLESWKKHHKVILLAVISCSVIFGLRHLINLITMPNALLLTLAQVIFTFMAGLYLCAVYLRTENIWVCITIHFLEDFGTSIWEIYSSSAQTAAVSDGSPGAALGMIALQIPYVIFAVLMLKDKNWHGIWQRDKERNFIHR